MPGRDQDSFFLIGYTPREATYGAGVADGALTVWHEVEAPTLAQYKPEEITNQTKAKGHPYVGAGRGTLIKERVTYPIEFDANLELVAFLMCSMFANRTGGGTPPNYTHTIKYPGAAVINPWSFSFIHASDRSSTASFFKYNGVYCSSLELTMAGRGPIKAKAELVGDGSQVAAAAITPPAIGSAITGQLMLYSQITCALGPNGNESIAELLEKAVLRMSIDPQERDRPGHTTKTGAVRFGKTSPTVDLKLTVEGQKGDTIYNYWTGHTKLVLDFRVVVGANSEFRLQGGECRIPRDTGGDIEKFDGVVHQLEFPVRQEWDTDDSSPYVITIKDQTAAYLHTS